MQRQRRKLTVEVAIELRRKDGWPVAQRDQRGARARTGRQLRRRAGTGRGGSAVGDVGQSWQPAVCRGGEAAAAAAGADRGAAQAPGGWNGNVVRTTSEAIDQAVDAVPRGELLACLRQGKPHRGPRSKDGERRGPVSAIVPGHPPGGGGHLGAP